MIIFLNSYEKNKLSNQEIVTIALYLLGKGQKGFDREDCKIRWTISGSFRWISDPNMISDSNTWDALSNARKKMV